MVGVCSIHQPSCQGRETHSAFVPNVCCPLRFLDGSIHAKPCFETRCLDSWHVCQYCQDQRTVSRSPQIVNNAAVASSVVECSLSATEESQSNYAPDMLIGQATHACSCFLPLSPQNYARLHISHHVKASRSSGRAKAQTCPCSVNSIQCASKNDIIEAHPNFTAMR